MRDATMDQAMETIDAKMYPTPKRPVLAMLEKILETATKSPKDKMGLKSIFPNRRNLKDPVLLKWPHRQILL